MVSDHEKITVDVVIEIPKGSRNKYEFDKQTRRSVLTLKIVSSCSCIAE